MYSVRKDVTETDKRITVLNYKYPVNYNEDQSLYFKHARAIW